ncbi:hypothetical protein V6U78_06205 [Marinospirillum sp. MEB164]|uniref:Porin n=1 Tax=Marinospirillum alkalitolerans TaxID=3123374 RepID=A0ABW8PXB9_9GAMM
MKLRHKLAGTVALPLALAVAASTATAATIFENDQHRVNFGGFVAAQANWTIFDDAVGQDSDIDYGMSLGTSRMNLSYTRQTDAGPITILFENDFNGPSGSNYRLRHAAIMWDGWVAGFSWSGAANLTGLGETIDAGGTANTSAMAQRTMVLGRNIPVAEGMTVGVFLEDRTNSFSTGVGQTDRDANTALPDAVVNFRANLGATQLFGAATLLQFDDAEATGDAKTESQVELTFGARSQITDELRVHLALTNTNDNDDTYVSVGAQYRINQQLRTNLLVEQALRDADDSDYTALWANAFYTMPSGWEWGGELRYMTADDNAGKLNGLGDSDMRISLQAKYAF